MLHDSVRAEKLRIQAGAGNIQVGRQEFCDYSSFSMEEISSLFWNLPVRLSRFMELRYLAKRRF